MTEPVLKVDGLRTGYGGLTAVWDVSFSVFASKITAILGANGAGKTTTLRAIAGLNPAPAGAISLLGSDITKVPAHRRAAMGLAFVPDGKPVFRARTVEENLILGSTPRNIRGAALRTSLDESYDQFPVLAERRRMRAGVLSGGQQQLLALAQALIAKPTVLLLDEPSMGLAPIVFLDILQTIRRLSDDGLAVVLVEQAIEGAMAIADELVLVRIGRSVFAGSPDDPAARAAIEAAYLTEGAPIAPHHDNRRDVS
jgi:branched-chain amino acid transport system ATP-binding protein